MFAKGLEDVPTFFVCLDDPTFSKGKDIQSRVCIRVLGPILMYCPGHVGSGKLWQQLAF